MTEAATAASSTSRIRLTEIVASKTNPRTSFTAPDIAELAASIKKHGVFQPLLLRVHPTKPGTYELVDGERRLRAAKEAGLADVPAMVSDLTDDQVLEIQIVSFLQRKDLTAIEEAQCFNTMLVKKYTHERIAEKVGRSVQYVRDRCRLLNLVKGAVELLQAKRIEVGHAILLARLSPEDQVRIIREPEAGGFYDSSRDSGLWQRQRALPVTSEQLGDDGDAEAGEESSEHLKAVSVRELAAWIDRHVKLNPEAPETAELFPEAAALVKAAEEPTLGEKPLKVIHITFDHQLPDDVKKVEGPKVYGPRSWVRADGKAGSKTCASSVAGIVVAGPARGEGFHVCTAKKTCTVHYKAEITAAKKRQTEVEQSGKTGAERAALEKEKKEAAEKKAKEAMERFRRAVPAIEVATAEKIKSMPVAKLMAVLDEALLGWEEKQGLATAAKLMPAANTADAWVRRTVFAGIAGTLRDMYVREDDVTSELKAYGIDVPKIVASANENDAATKAARKKPAKATKAKK